MSPDPQQYPGLAPEDAIVREISKPNGDLVTIFESGSVTVWQPGELPRTHTPEGRTFTLDAAGLAIEITAPHDLPLDERPLNVASNAIEEIGQHLSNFADRRFVFEGKPYRSVEGWYQGLKWPDEGGRKAAAKLHGPAAKTAGKGAPASATFSFGGVDYAFGSAEHHALVKAVITCSLEQSPEVLQAFLATHPRPIVHHTGRPEKAGTSLPGTKFAQMLEEIRAEHMPPPSS